MLTNVEQVALFLGDVSLRIALAAAVIYGALALLRVRNPAVRHRAQTVLLLGMFALPILVALAPGWGIQLFDAPSLTFAHDREPTRSQLPGEPARGQKSDGSSAVSPSNPVPFDATDNKSNAVIESIASATETPVTAVNITDELPKSEGRAAAAAIGLSRLWRLAACSLLAIYMCIALLLLVRLGIGIRTVRRLIRRSVVLRSIDGVELLMSSEIAVPVTAGCWRQRIIVPGEWSSWPTTKQGAVLRHELEHVARRDVTINLLAALCCCLYWFHPLSWVLARRLSSLAETCCDDAVLRDTTSPTAYARYLLEFATLASRHGATRNLVTAMAREGQIASRIRQILDATRQIPSRPRRLHLTSAALATLCGIFAIASVHGEQTLPDEAFGNVTDGLANDSSSAAATTANASQGAELRNSEIINAQIVDKDGAPIPDAEVFVASVRDSLTPEKSRIFARVTSDEMGNVAIPWGDVPQFRNDLERLYSDSAFQEQHVSLTVAAAGYVPLRTSASFLKRDENKVTLAKCATPIRGRIVNLEGAPISGVHVRVCKIEFSSGNVDAWLNEAQKNPPSQGLKSARNVSSGINSFPGAFFPSPPVNLMGLPIDWLSTTTDQDGEFELEGFPENALVKLILESNEIAKAHTYVLTRETEPFPAPEFSGSNHAQQCYGATFEYVAQPCQPIHGVVRDLDTGEPISGATVALQSVIVEGTASRIEMSRFLETTTNAAGEYTLPGMAPASRQSELSYLLQVSPPRGSPYLRWPNVQVPKQDGLTPIELDIGVKQGVVITGRLLDAKTGAPIDGLVAYYPLMDNQHLDEFPNYRRSQSSALHDLYATGPDGSFRIPAIPGSGLLVGTGIEVNKYLPGAGAAEAGWPAKERPDFAVYMADPDIVHTIERLEIAPETVTVEQDVKLQPMQLQTFQVVDPAGEPVGGTTVAGTHPSFVLSGMRYTPGAILGNATHAEGSQIEVFGLEAVQRRRLLIRDWNHQWGAAVWARFGEPQQIKLAPLATLRGRLLDNAGQPIAGQRIEVVIPLEEIVAPIPSTTFGKSRLRQEVSSAMTDSEGRFTLERIFPDVRMQLQIGRKPLREVDPVAAGADVDLGDILPATH